MYHFDLCHLTDAESLYVDGGTHPVCQACSGILHPCDVFGMQLSSVIERQFTR